MSYIPHPLSDREFNVKGSRRTPKVFGSYHFLILFIPEKDQEEEQTLCAFL
jgi:hypothetical protein